VLALSLCVLCAYQWHDQATQRQLVESLNQQLSQKLAMIQGYTNTIQNFDTQVAQMEAHIAGLEGTIKTNQELILAQKRENNRLEAQGTSLSNQIVEYKKAVDQFQSKLKEAYDSIQKQNDAIKEVAAQRDEFVKKLNESVKDRNDVVLKYNDLVERIQKQQATNKPPAN